jgi:hypothetical protein
VESYRFAFFNRRRNNCKKRTDGVSGRTSPDVPDFRLRASAAERRRVDRDQCSTPPVLLGATRK